MHWKNTIKCMLAIAVGLAAGVFCFFQPQLRASRGAGESAAAAFHDAEGYAWQETENMVLIAYRSPEGEACVSFVYKDAPDWAYGKRVGTPPGSGGLTQAELDAVRETAFRGGVRFSFTGLMDEDLEQFQKGKENAVIKKLSELYGSTAKGAAYSAAPAGESCTLPDSLSVATAAATLAARFGIPVPEAAALAQSIAGGTAEPGAELGVAVDVEAYAGTAAWAAEPGGEERSFQHKFLFVYNPTNPSTDLYDFLVELGN